MNKVFTNYRINKHINRNGINILMKNIHKRTTSSSVVVFNTIPESEDQIQENWIIKKKKSGKFEYTSLDKNDNSLKNSFLNSLTHSDVIVVVLVCDMKQKIDKDKYIKEMWGFKIVNEGKKTVFKEFTSEEIYGFSTTNINTGKSIPPAKEVVYCGPDGKICGWDMI